MKTSITNEIVRALHGLAAAHGHEWATVMTIDECLGHETIEGLQEAFENHPSRGEWPGIGPAMSHTTGTGRLSWEVEYRNRAILFEVARPLPEGVAVTQVAHHHFDSGRVVVARGWLQLRTGSGEIAANLFTPDGMEWAECQDRHAQTLLFAMAAAAPGADLRWAFKALECAWEVDSFVTRVTEEPVASYKVSDMAHCAIVADSPIGPLHCDGNSLYAVIDGEWYGVTADYA